MGFLVFNETDGIYASPDEFETTEQAEEFCKEFRLRFKEQGYYKTSRWEKISPQDVKLKIMEA